MSLQTVKREVRKQLSKEWQRSWDRQSEGGANSYYCLKPKVPNERFHSVGKKRVEAKLIRVQTGHSRLRDHFNKLFPDESPNCQCGNNRQTVNHIMLDCHLLQKEREDLMDKVELCYVKHQTPIWEREVNASALLHPRHTSQQTRIEVTRAVLTFLNSISKKVSI